MTWLRASIVAAILLVAAAVPSIAGSSPPPGLHVSVIDQATIDFPFCDLGGGPEPEPGLYFNLNAANVREISPSGDVMTTSSTAVASIREVVRSEFRCSSGGGFSADCYPAGNTFPDANLPSGALTFGPQPGTASLEAAFDCFGLSGTAHVNVDVTWSPGENTVRSLRFSSPWFFFVPVIGSVSDGTTEFVHASTTGSVIELTQVFPR